MRGPGAAALLGRALTASAARAGTAITIDRDESATWQSATFSGARHAFEASAPATIAPWLAEVAEMDVPLAGHLLADLLVTRQAEAAGMIRFRIEALTVSASER